MEPKNKNKENTVEIIPDDVEDILIKAAESFGIEWAIQLDEPTE